MRVYFPQPVDCFDRPEQGEPRGQVGRGYLWSEAGDVQSFRDGVHDGLLRQPYSKLEEIFVSPSSDFGPKPALAMFIVGMR